MSEKLLMSKINPQLAISGETYDAAEMFCAGYKKFLDEGKTEREAVCAAQAKAVAAGFVPFNARKKYLPGDKIFVNNRGKAMILAVVGKKPVEDGARILAAHIDSPRLDLKPNPLYEADELALFKTHYYGGIRKYQWTTIPLALHGVVCLKDGTCVNIRIGEDPSDPQFCITDLLPHLSAEQNKRPLSEGVKGEELNILIGSRPFACDGGSDLVKLNVMKILNERYGIVESDFQSAELEAVPAAAARDIGFDRSMIGSYGHDDRVCAYPALEAVLHTAEPEYTAITVLTDKEEIGSEGNTGLNSAYLGDFIRELCAAQKGSALRAFANSKCLSADVNAAFDPTFSSVFEKRNSSLVGHGVCFTKYTGARGKSGSNDASAELMAYCRRLLDDNKVLWQTGELGKVDNGGGGTVAKYVASLNIDVVDVGVPVLSMHAPWEVVSKLDVYMTYLAFEAFFR